MKPDWKDAPEWANYLAMDESGIWAWFENKPAINGNEWYAKNGGMYELAFSFDTSLETRPEKP